MKHWEAILIACGVLVLTHFGVYIYGWSEGLGSAIRGYKSPPGSRGRKWWKEVLESEEMFDDG